ncbi:MAG: efflux RND transporter periplasmic adaptor subunit [Hyphomonadaceae bacterium]
MPRLLSIMLGAIALIAAVVGIRSLMPDGDSNPNVTADRIPTLDKALPDAPGQHAGTVVFVRSSAENRTLYLSLGGRSEAEIGEVAFGAAGKVTATPVKEGEVVEAGTLICGLDVDGAGAKVKQAEAVASRKREAYNSAQTRLANGWVSEAWVKAAKSELDEAQAALEVARNEFNRMQAVAPFRGVLEKKVATPGQFVSLGSPCGTVVRLDPISFVAGASERQATQILQDAPVRVRLPSGTEVAGAVSYVSRVADPRSRNFLVKVAAPNPGNRIPVGRTAELKIDIGPGKAHRVSPKLLTTDEQGRIGIRYLDVGGVVSFAPADIVEESADVAWVTGLPDDAQLVAEGQDNVRPGMRVTPVIREDATPASGG